jgi:tRNA-splicing ligase RtcB (3'-phosphate/5'-hydroxy nucleic acid ligase)
MTMQRFTDKAVFLPWDTIEAEAKNQILNTAKMPFVFQHIAVMPDCHYGRGATVGTALPTKGAIIPAAVGVDIGCGMIGCRTPLKRTDIPNPAAVRAGIERRIPMSGGKNAAFDRNSRGKVDTLVQLAKDTRATPDQFDKKWSLALGTLGSGNHFIELAEDLDGPCG